VKGKKKGSDLDIRHFKCRMSRSDPLSYEPSDKNKIPQNCRSGDHALAAANTGVVCRPADGNGAPIFRRRHPREGGDPDIKPSVKKIVENLDSRLRGNDGKAGPRLSPG